MICNKPSTSVRSTGSKRTSAFQSSRQLRLPVQCVARPARKAEVVSQPQQIESGMLATAALLTPFITQVGDACAKGGEYGLLEGRTFALIHPAVMLSLCAATGYAGYLGWQWRRLREVGEELRATKALIPAVAEGEQPSPAAKESMQKVEQLDKVGGRLDGRAARYIACFRIT